MKQCKVCNTELQGQQQKYCSNNCKQKDHWHKVKEQTNTYHSQTIRGLRRKVEFINKMGGGCSKCGYNHNISALDFHHVDSNLKSFQVDLRRFSNTSIEKLEEELNKCIILCSNCHREQHNPELEKNNVLRIIGLLAQRSVATPS